MGLFQGIKDSLFISKCITQFKQVLPASAQHAEQFCNTNSEFLLENRDRGASAGQAVDYLCLFMLDAPDNNMLKRTGQGAESLIHASNYGMAILATWPNTSYAKAFREALDNFIEFTNNTPIAKDWDMLKNRQS
jgi:hypothetical protein